MLEIPPYPRAVNAKRRATWMPLESGTTWQRLARRVPIGVALTSALVTVQLVLAVWHGTNLAETMVGGLVWFVGTVAVLVIVAVVRNPQPSADFISGRIRFGRRVIRFVEIDRARQLTTGQPTTGPPSNVVLLLGDGVDNRGSVCLHRSLNPAMNLATQKRLLLVLERSSVPLVTRPVGRGAARKVPAHSFDLTKPAAIALVREQRHQE